MTVGVFWQQRARYYSFYYSGCLLPLPWQIARFYVRMNICGGATLSMFLKQQFVELIIRPEERVQKPTLFPSIFCRLFDLVP